MYTKRTRARVPAPTGDEGGPIIPVTRKPGQEFHGTRRRFFEMPSPGRIIAAVWIEGRPKMVYNSPQPTFRNTGDLPWNVR